MPPVLVRPLTVLALLAASTAALAQDGFPIDVELVRPGLSPAGGFAVDAPQAVAPLVWSAGALIQYENTPLRLFDNGDVVGSLVAQRTAIQLHAGLSISKRTSFSLLLPIGAHFGAGDVEYARNGAGLGDIALTTRVQAGTWGRFTLGAAGTLFFPTGNREQYMGERLPRLRAGLLGYTDFGRVKLLTNLFAHLREPVQTGFDFTAGSELHIDLGVQGVVVPGQLDLIGEVVSRIGLAKGSDGGRLASEALVGARYTPRPDLRVDFAIGRGITEGYGTTMIRAMVGLTYLHTPKPKIEPVAALVEEEEELPEVEDPPPPPVDPPPPPPPPAAALTGEEIVFRDPIAFELGSTVLLPSSGPVLDAVAGVILEHPEIGMVVIEGHASQEGGFAYNYELSGDRARAIYEALVLRGVHPKRLSYRGAGEVEGVVEGEGADLAQNRRVVFNVVRQYQPGEARPVWSDTVLLPWSGEAHAVGKAPPGGAPPSAPPAGEAPPSSPQGAPPAPDESSPSSPPVQAPPAEEAPVPAEPTP